MTKQQIAALDGEFTWDFGQEFFIETSKGNFVWSDPDYAGDNTLKEYDGTYSQWIGKGYGRYKGRHLIGKYCGEFILVQ